MADIVVTIAVEFAKGLVKPAIHEGQYLFCVNKVIRNLNNEKEELISKRDGILSVVEQAIQRTEIIEDAVNKWLNDVESLLGEVEKLEQDVKESLCFQGWCPTWRGYRLCREISKKTKTITAFKNRERFEPFSHPAPLPGIEYVSSENFTYFESTKVAYNQLLEALQDDNTYIIGLYGMGGSGKTTLATEVGKKVKSELKLFDQVISVTVSQTPNIERIQEKMEDMLGFKMEEKSKEGRAERLWLRLNAEKRVLIIVDDVWRKLNLNDIGIRSNNNEKPNFKVLLTTRRKQVCVSMDCQKAILLDLLSKTEGWSLFRKYAGIGDGSPSKLLEVARKVSDECKELPVAIKAVGSSLKEKGYDEWKVALEKLRNPERFDDNEEDGFTDVFTCLKLSYYYLKDKEAEMLFLMCSMFPEDHEIIVEDLIRYAVGLGVCENFNSLDLARSCIRAGINKLVHSCLLFYYEEEDHVKMHDVVRDVALRIASRLEDRKILLSLANNLNSLAENGAIKDYFAISSWYTKTFLISCQLDAPKLEILLLQTDDENSLEFSFASSEGAKELKVMSILSSPFRYLPKSSLLPQLTQWLTNLRTLRLQAWKLDDLSFLISLTRLEVLDLRWCHLEELPKGMEKLNKLKLLDLSNCELPKNFNYEALGSFPQLEELYADGLIFPSEVMKDIVTLTGLQRFWIQPRCVFEVDDDGKSTRVLSLQDCNISDFSASKQNLLQRAEHVCLLDLHGGCKNVMPDMVRVVGGMNELTSLHFGNCSEIECLIDTTYLHVGSFQEDTSLPKLVKLTLSEMFDLKEVCRGPPLLVLGFFEKLEQLFIRTCPQLHSIFPETSKLCNLKILKIGNYNPYSIYTWESFGCTTVVSLLSVSVAQSLQKLEELSIEGCEELKHIITSEGEGGTNTGDSSQLMFPNLKKLLVSFCPNLEFILPMAFALQGLLQLQDIEISNADQLEVVFRHTTEDKTDNNEDQILLPNLGKLKLKKLPSFVNILHGFNFHMPKLQKLSTNECPKFGPILRRTQGISFHRASEALKGQVSCLITATWSELCEQRLSAALEAFLNLEVLHETKSRAQGIFHLQVEAKTNSNTEWKPLYSNLQKLKLCNLPELRFIWKGFPKFLNLETLVKVSLTDCQKLKTIFSPDIVRCLPKLETLLISNCGELEEIISSYSENAQLRHPTAHSQQQACCFPKLDCIEVEQCSKLKCLFYGFKACHFPTLEKLVISNCGELEQIISSKLENAQLTHPTAHSQQQVCCFPKLDYIQVEQCSKLKCLFYGFKASHFPTLERLVISNCGELEQIISSKLGNEQLTHPTAHSQQVCCFPKLDWIEVEQCSKLKCLFYGFKAYHFPTLDRLVISNCGELEQILSSKLENAQLTHPTANSQQEVCCFPQLSHIEVKQCSKLKYFFYGFKAYHFPKLEIFKIEDCPQLEQAVGLKIEVGDKSFEREASENGNIALFSKLHDLTVVGCPKYSLTSSESRTPCLHMTTQKGQVFWLITTSSSLQASLNLEELHLTKSRAEGIFQLQVEGETSNNSEWKPWKSNLSSLELCNLPELRFIWNGFSKFMSLENLWNVSLVECPKLKTIFSPDIVKCLPNLWNLSISNCKELEEIILSDSENAQLRLPSSCPKQEVCFPRLYSIEVKQCNKLKCILYDSMTCHFPKLGSLEIEECSQLEQAVRFKIEEGDKSFRRDASEDGHLILFPGLHSLTVMDCPKYSLTSNESRTSCLHITTQKGQVFWLITTFASLLAFLNLYELHLTKSRAEGIFQLQVEKEISSNSEWKPLKSSLGVLTFCNLPELRFIWNGFSKFLSLENLIKVSLIDCSKLKTIFSDIVRSLPMLERLLLSNCEELEEIISSDSENAQIKHPFSYPQQVCFPQLYSIEVEQCNKLKCLFYDPMACHFPELGYLKIEECSQIEQAFGSKGGADDESSQRWANEDGDRILLPKLRKLVLKSLPIFFEISGGFNLQQPMHKYIVTDCPRYNLNFAKASSSYQHATTHGEYYDEESSDGEYSDKESFDGA